MSEDGPYCLDDINKIAPFIKSNIYIVDRQGLNKGIYKTDLPYNNKIYLLHDYQHYILAKKFGAPYIQVIYVISRPQETIGR